MFHGYRKLGTVSDISIWNTHGFTSRKVACARKRKHHLAVFFRNWWKIDNFEGLDYRLHVFFDVVQSQRIKQSVIGLVNRHSGIIFRWDCKVPNQCGRFGNQDVIKVTLSVRKDFRPANALKVLINTSYMIVSLCASKMVTVLFDDFLFKQRS